MARRRVGIQKRRVRRVGGAVRRKMRGKRGRGMSGWDGFKYGFSLPFKAASSILPFVL